MSYGLASCVPLSVTGPSIFSQLHRAGQAVVLPL